MRELEKAIEAIVRADEDAKVDAKVEKSRQEHAEAKKARDKLVKDLAFTVLAVRAGEIVRHEVKGYSSQQGGHRHSDGRKPGEPCCSSVPRTQAVDGQKVDVFVDLGLELEVPNHKNVRLSGDMEEVHEHTVRVVPGTTGSLRQVPVFVRAIAGSHANLEVWAGVKSLCEKEYEALQARYDAAVLERQPAAERVAEKHARKLLKGRARAARPDNVAKREAAARERARESLSGLLGNECKRVLDRWSPPELLGYLRLCQTEGHVLRELMGWSSKLPLGSEKIQLEDVEAAIEMAKIRDVMES